MRSCRIQGKAAKKLDRAELLGSLQKQMAVKQERDLVTREAELAEVCWQHAMPQNWMMCGLRGACERATHPSRFKIQSLISLGHMTA